MPKARELPASKLTHRDVRALAKAAEEAGWRIGISSSGHVRFIAPDGTKIFTSQTPSDHRSVKNCRAQLRRKGLEC